MIYLIAYSAANGVGFYLDDLANLRTVRYNELVTREASEDQLRRALRYLSYVNKPETFDRLTELRDFLSAAYDTEHPNA